MMPLNRVTFLIGFSLAFSLVSEAVSRSNVVLIYADDISAREFPVYGSTVWSGHRGSDTSDLAARGRMPVVDRLAREGVWFANAWAATVCSPSRAMMMTGRYAHLHKWWHNGDYGRVPDGDKKRKRTVALYETSPLLIGHVAQQAGYATLWTGKTQMKEADLQRFGFDEGVFTPGWFPHLPDNPYTDFKLVNEGAYGKSKLFDSDTGKEVQSYGQMSWYWQPAVALMNHPNSKEPMTWWPNTAESRDRYGLHTYGPDVEIELTLNFIDRQHAAGKPFFVYHTTHLGHDAYDWIRPESTDKWPGTPILHWDGERYTRTEPRITGDEGEYDTHGTVTPPGMKSHLEYLDYTVWLYLEKLKELGQLENTVIILAADNGTSGYGKTMHDRQRGCHVPLIVSAPGVEMAKRGRLDQVASMADILPTLAEVVGTEIPADYELDGRSLWPLLTTDAEDHRGWTYAYKSERQLIRGQHVMRDGNDRWWDVSEEPSDLIDFKPIKDWQTVSPAHRDERTRLESVLPRYDNYETEHDPPAGTVSP